MTHTKGTPRFDTVDMQCIARLRRDARERITSIAEHLQLPSSTAYDRVVRLRAHGIRFTSLVDWSFLGCSLTVCFLVPYNKEIANHPNVNTCVRVSPDALFLECVFASMLEIELFHASVPRARVYPVIETLKKEGFVPELQT